MTVPCKIPHLMKLIINEPAVLRSSLGAVRYYQGVAKHLCWPGKIEKMRMRNVPGIFERIGEFLPHGRQDAILWSPCHRGPVFARNHVVTVLDCLNIQYTYRDDWRLPLLRRTFALLLGNATAVVTISDATRDAVLDCFGIDPEKVVSIPGPADFRDEFALGIAESPGADADGSDFILMITNTLPHKNTARAAQALAASTAARRGVKLRVVGSLDPEGMALCAAAGLVVEQYRKVEDAALRNWLRKSRFLFSPSLQEGLNLPVGEALSLGGNVLCSDIAVHREFYDGAVLFCDPLEPRAMTAAIDDALSRNAPWKLPGPVRPRRTFADVAAGYRAIFERVAAGDFPGL